MTRVFHTATEEDTIALGRQLARELPQKAVVLLIGNLGAGKTTLAKGIVQGLGAAAPEEVSSPTFTLIHEFADRVYHVDLYRLEGSRDLYSIGLDDFLGKEGVTIVEWSERLSLPFPLAAEIEIVDAGDDLRTLHIRLPEKDGKKRSGRRSN